jgi:AbrB family looped-hinge helix DNA binding protein
MPHGIMMIRGRRQMAATRTSVVQEKGQVTIPVEIRRKLGLKPGDMVEFVETEEGVVIAPRQVVAVDVLREIGERLKARGISLEELLADGRDLRGDLQKKMYGLDAEAEDAS